MIEGGHNPDALQLSLLPPRKLEVCWQVVGKLDAAFAGKAHLSVDETLFDLVVRLDGLVLQPVDVWNRQ